MGADLTGKDWRAADRTAHGELCALLQGLCGGCAPGCAGYPFDFIRCCAGCALYNEGMTRMVESTEVV